jgi:glycerol-3-phosphate dehydrogenase subunit B
VGAGSPAGLRFEAARDALLARLEVRRLRGRVLEVRRAGRTLTVEIEGHDALVTADAVVLAVGGLAGGGLLYAPPEREAGDDLPPRGRVPFALSLCAPVELSFGGPERMDIVASMHGPELDTSAWPRGDRAGLLERVGVRCDGVRAAEGITAAGDAVAGHPRTMLEAVASGIAAGAF